MMKLSTRGLTADSCTAIAVIVVLAPADANAASTRAEYIAQVDPICQAFVDPENAALRAYRKNAKRWDRLASKGTLKAWLKQTRRVSRSLLRLTQLDTTLNDQIAAVPPPAADAGAIATWLNARVQANAFAASAAAALNRPVPAINKYFKLIDRANAALAASTRAIAGFGFQVCGVTV
jgi:hypothetical protein